MAPLMQPGNPSGKATQVSVLKETWRSNPSCLPVLFALAKVQSETSTPRPIRSCAPSHSHSHEALCTPASAFHPSSPPHSCALGPLTPFPTTSKSPTCTVLLPPVLLTVASSLRTLLLQLPYVVTIFSYPLYFRTTSWLDISMGNIINYK